MHHLRYLTAIFALRRSISRHQEIGLCMHPGSQPQQSLFLQELVEDVCNKARGWMTVLVRRTPHPVIVTEMTSGDDTGL